MKNCLEYRPVTFLVIQKSNATKVVVIIKGITNALEDDPNNKEALC